MSAQLSTVEPTDRREELVPALRSLSATLAVGRLLHQASAAQLTQAFQAVRS